MMRRLENIEEDDPVNKVAEDEKDNDSDSGEGSIDDREVFTCWKRMNQTRHLKKERMMWKLLLSKITLMRSRDAEYVYGQAIEMAKHAKKMGNYDEEVKHTEEAESARLCIPHFNIEGLLGWKPQQHEHPNERFLQQRQHQEETRSQ